jgi:hypothetical protein
MRNAVFVSILLVLGGATYLRAQDASEDYQAHFGWEEQGAAAAPAVDEGPHSMREAIQQGRGYHIGARDQAAGAADGKDVHVVEEGDTLWDLSANYLGDPWRWPELWSFNPEITNPHWIYPLDQLRLSTLVAEQEKAAADVRASGGPVEQPTSAGLLSGTETAASVVVPKDMLKPGVIFLRDEGYLDQDAMRTVGQIIGGPEEHMLLSPSDQLYVRFRTDHDVRTGESYAVFRTMKETEREADERGTLVRVIGTVIVRSYDREKRIARGLVSEALDPIERGMYIAKLDRRFDLVETARNGANVVAHIIASVQPRTLLGYGNVVFLDVGEGHGIRPGNRFFVVRRGDVWLGSLTVEATEVGNVVEVPEYDPTVLPKEVIAELRVVKVRKHTTIALITRSDTDVALGDVAEMRVGF